MATSTFYAGYMQNNYSMVGAQRLFDHLGVGGSKKWDNATKTVTYIFKGHEVKITDGKNTVMIDGQPFTLSVPAVVTNNTLFVPVNSLLQAIGKVSGETFNLKYDQKTQQLNLDTSYNGLDATKPLYTTAPKPGRLRIFNPVTGKDEYADPKNIGTIQKNPEVEIQTIANERRIIREVRENGDDMRRLAQKFGRNLTDAELETIVRHGSDSFELINMLGDMERLEGFADINKQLYGGTINLDQARELESKWINPGRMQSGVMAEEFVKAHPEILEDIKIFGGKDFTQQEAISWRMGENETFAAEFEKAQKTKAAAFKPTETNAPISWEEGELKLKGKRQSWV